MAKRHRYKDVAITQMTNNGSPNRAGCLEYRGEALFTSTYNYCYFGKRTLKKIKGSSLGGNYVGVDDQEIYRVMKMSKKEF